MGSGTNAFLEAVILLFGIKLKEINSNTHTHTENATQEKTLRKYHTNICTLMNTLIAMAAVATTKNKKKN